MTGFARGFVATLLCGALSSAQAWDSRTLSGPVAVNGHTIPYPEFAVYVMPRSRISAAFVDPAAGGEVAFLGESRAVGEGDFTAPDEPGLEVLEIRNNASGETARINVFTLVPTSQMRADQRLNGYRIGKYPTHPRRGLDIYLPPRGFVEVTQENANTRVSPNFTLGQFVSKQASGYPKYLVLRASLLLKLENILAALNNAGYPTRGFVIMSGYRTPFYNRSIGNVQYSRHLWGGAADLYIDQDPVDDRMDDLNGDGRIDRADARWLASFIDEMSRRGLFGPQVGGLGVYGSTSAHGPFVHVDVRGSRARW